MDTNILTKIFTNQVQEHSKGLSAILPSSSWPHCRDMEYFNMHKSINVIHYINRLNGKDHMIV